MLGPSEILAIMNNRVIKTNFSQFISRNCYTLKFIDPLHFKGLLEDTQYSVKIINVIASFFQGKRQLAICFIVLHIIFFEEII